MAEAITQNPTPEDGKGRLKKMGILGGAIGTAFVGFDAYSRIKDGENAPVAIGKALLTNAAWNMLPGGLVGAAALMGVQMAPEVSRIIDMKRAQLSSRSVAFGGGFTQNAAQETMKQIGIQNIMQARSSANAIMARHAQGAVKSY